jgi:ribonucleotide reductase alpha subunit
MTDKRMSETAMRNAKNAFAQGIEDENNGAYSSRRLRIAEKCRHFYDEARKLRAEQLAPERAAKLAEDEANGVVQSEPKPSIFEAREKARKLNSELAARRRKAEFG